MRHKRIPHKPKPDSNLLPQARHQKISYKDVMKGYEAKVASINFRRDMLTRQRNSNYVNEFNRISSVLTSNMSGLPQVSLERLRRRQTELTQMANSAH